MAWTRRSIIKQKKGGEGSANILANGEKTIKYGKKITTEKIRNAAESNGLEIQKRKNATIFLKNKKEVAKLVDQNLLIIKKEADSKLALSLAADLE